MGRVKGLKLANFPTFEGREVVGDERKLFWFLFDPETLVQKFLLFYLKFHGIYVASWF